MVEYANLQNVEFAAGFADFQHFFTALYPPSYLEYRFFSHFAFSEGYRTKNFTCPRVSVYWLVCKNKEILTPFV